MWIIPTCPFPIPLMNNLVAGNKSGHSSATSQPEPGATFCLERRWQVSCELVHKFCKEHSFCLNAGRTHVLFLMLKTASVMRRYRMNLVHFSIVHDQSHSPFLDGVPAKNRCYAQGCHDPMTSYEPSLSSTCALSTCWLLDEAVVRFIFKKV